VQGHTILKKKLVTVTSVYMKVLSNYFTFKPSNFGTESKISFRFFVSSAWFSFCKPESCSVN